MQKQLARHRNTQRGATAIEYGLIVGLIALGIVVGAQALGTGLGAGFNSLAGRVTALFATNNGGGS
ncbi:MULTISPECIES: Flp family type IVb pilin [unclassified Cupriavidus]|uniref:Flp family type IVb pilin n=1 Tax=unclassified Cupriavidus TaxID=2640874 RepID=UPI001C0020DE|nr:MULTISPECIES: Flp family type IVb pilin [unclassified Cupriavidus]MCA3182278.1 Flp family type IVb pilin [Cupriavidus sp.]MCA3191715.1 Flp family type IVb pilin [Cupriavidus sp.]MCA3197945.1 Flp family type IVb pilin [Cupriavidus sp.]MCA3200629.1 Flp family type IVb pilin [Cupriavidus sp.]MCA3207480.1 Flp family type IVb pilin [Cupriavidus sp.]